MNDSEKVAKAKAKQEERNRQLREENSAPLVAYSGEVARDGLPLARYRSF